MRNFLLTLTAISFFVFIAFFFTDSEKKIPSEINSILSDCSLEKTSCVVNLKDNHKIIFNLEPKGLPVMELLTLSIEGLSDSQNILKIWFEGMGMSMGTHFMLPVSNNNDSFNNYLTNFKGMIPVCSIDAQMLWLLNVQFKHKSQLYLVQFQLKTISSD